jgi:hypothetical protein
VVRLLGLGISPSQGLCCSSLRRRALIQPGVGHLPLVWSFRYSTDALDKQMVIQQNVFSARTHESVATSSSLIAYTQPKTGSFFLVTIVTHTENMQTYIGYMSGEGFEPTIPAVMRSKIICGLIPAVTVKLDYY